MSPRTVSRPLAPREPAAIVEQCKRVGVTAIVVGAVFAIAGVYLVAVGQSEQAFLFPGVAIVAIAALTILVAAVTRGVAARYPRVESLSARNDALLLPLLFAPVAGIVLTVFFGGDSAGRFGVAIMTVFVAAPALMIYTFNRKIIRDACHMQEISV